MNDIKIITIEGVPCYEKDGTAYVKLDISVRGLGFVDVKNGVEYIRWNYVFTLLNKLGFSQQVAKDGFIPEDVFYKLAMRAKNSAAMAFQDKVVEILKSIRRTGQYSVKPAYDMTATDPMFAAMTDPRNVAQILIKLADEREAKERAEHALVASQQSVKLLEAKVEADAPKVAFSEELETSDKCITIKQLSVLLYQNGYVTGEKRLFDEMRGDGFLCTRGEYKNEPAQRYLEMGLFVVKTSTFQYNSGSVGVSRKTLVTQKGVKYLLNYYLKKHGLLVESSANILLPENTQAMFSLVQ